MQQQQGAAQLQSDRLLQRGRNCLQPEQYVRAVFDRNAACL